MKKLIFVLVAALSMSCASYAQMTEKELKKATKTAQKQVKEAQKEMDRDDIEDKKHAKQLIDDAMKNPLLKDWDQTWYQAARVYMHYYDLENRKSYQNAPYDTVGLFNYLTKWYRYDIIADSLQQIPNEKGKTSDEVRNTHAKDIYRTFSDFVKGGIFYYNKHDYAKAYEMFDNYFTMAENPLIKSYTDKDTIFQANKAYYAYYPALAAYALEDWNNTIKYALIGINDEENGEPSTELLCDSYVSLGDTAKWLETLREGMFKYPTNDYYWGRLVNYYDRKNDMKSLESLAEEMIAINPDKAYNYYILALIAQQAKDYDKAIKQYEIAIEKDPTLTEAYNNLGLTILTQADEYVASKEPTNPKSLSSYYRSSEYKKVLAEQKEYYKKALPYFEKMRELEPTAVNKWGFLLQRVYYILDMPKEMAEVEARMNEAGVSF